MYNFKNILSVNTCQGADTLRKPQKVQKQPLFTEKILSGCLLWCIIKLPQKICTKARYLYNNEREKSSVFTIKFRN